MTQMTYEQFLQSIKPEMLNADGTFKGPQAGVNYALEGMGPKEAYDSILARYNAGKANYDSEEHKSVLQPYTDETFNSELNPAWRPGPVSTANGFLGNWGVPLAMLALPFVASGLGAGAAEGAAGTTAGGGAAGAGADFGAGTYAAGEGAAGAAGTTAGGGALGAGADFGAGTYAAGEGAAGAAGTGVSGLSAAQIAKAVATYGPGILKGAAGVAGLLGLGKAASTAGGSGVTSAAPGVDTLNMTAPHYAWNPSTGSYTNTDTGAVGPDMYGANSAAHIVKKASGGVAAGLRAAATHPRFIDGAGDGLSDSVPVTMSDGGPGRLADGEFVIPSDVVSGLGNGSSKAGAKQLYAMMDRIRQRAHGTKQQIRQVHPGKVLPA